MVGRRGRARTRNLQIRSLAVYPVDRTRRGYFHVERHSSLKRIWNSSSYMLHIRSKAMHPLLELLLRALEEFLEFRWWRARLLPPRPGAAGLPRPAISAFAAPRHENLFCKVTPKKASDNRRGPGSDRAWSLYESPACTTMIKQRRRCERTQLCVDFFLNIILLLKCPS
jgi:hypothetical protein